MIFTMFSCFFLWHPRLRHEDHKRAYVLIFLIHAPSVWASDVSVLNFPRRAFPLLKRFPGTVWTRQDRIKISVHLTCGSRPSCLSVCHAHYFSLSLVCIVCRSPLSFFPPLSFSLHVFISLPLWSTSHPSSFLSSPSLSTLHLWFFFPPSIFSFPLVSLLPSLAVFVVLSLFLSPQFFSFSTLFLPLSPSPPVLLLSLLK